MGKVLNKYIIILLSFVVFWIGVLPLVFTKTATFFCQKSMESSGYSIKLESPKLKLSLIPTAYFSLKNYRLPKKLMQEYKAGTILLPALIRFLRV